MSSLPEALPASSDLCVVSHDAGGAEVLASYIARNALSPSFVLEGPALGVFKRRLGDIQTLALDHAIARCKTVLCGTSWQSDLEWKAIAAARAANKPSVAFLDHWAHYHERFVRHEQQVLPDEIWVGDPVAYDMAKDTFPGLPLRLVNNPHFEDIREEVARISAASASDDKAGLRVLFVCEPLSEHGLKEFGDARHWGYTEFDALRYFFSHRHVLGAVPASIVIRPHPSEARDKYNAIAAEFGATVQVGGQRTLLEEVADNDVVAGCESMAMVVGLIAGRRVISCIPPGGRPCGLPQAGIEHMQALIAQHP